MTIKRVYLVFLVVLFFFGTFLQGAIPAAERAALIALYNATNGNKWYDNTGWKKPPLEADGFAQSGSEGSWLGVWVEEDHVVIIDINSNTLTGTLPGELGNLTQLKTLDLYLNSITGSIPASLGDLSNLEILYLDQNNLNGLIPAQLGQLSKLKNLDLRGNDLVGPLPEELRNLKELRRLSISGANLGSPIPEWISSLIKLEGLSMGGCGLTGSIPKELGELENLVDLILYSNDLSGTIPKELGQVSKLEQLHLDYNNLSGTIPPELGNLKKLHLLGLDMNQLTGPIPPEVGGLVSLEHLYLTGNKLEGPLPDELGSLRGLEYLFLGYNKITGQIPESLGNLTNLNRLVLAANYLSGPVPASLANLTKLSSFPLYTDFGHNALYADDEATRAFLSKYDWDWDQTQTIAPTNLAVTATGQTSMDVSWTPIKYQQDGGGYKVYYRPSYSNSWLYAGITADKSVSTYSIEGLYPGTRYYIAVKTVTDGYMFHDEPIVSQLSEETSAVTGSPLSEQNPPFGSFDTPLSGMTATGSIPVTGWALDDSGVEHVKIYRTLADRRVYIGDATFVEGARPDVAAAYPEYPANTRAGWGYMLLTNFLPNNGNGTYHLEALVTDVKGKQTSLGTKTINCDNANAIKPFGAIDTPFQGGAASGAEFVNFGWALTPQPNMIPTGGSTIDVWVDGVNIGKPVYNNYREDIATLFPDYANSGGAVGYFYLDTTVYANGVHTIQWTVRDDAGNFDGIGSRYFMIQNESPRYHTSQNTAASFDPGNRQVDDSPVRFRTGYDLAGEMRPIQPDKNGILVLRIAPLERVEVQGLPVGAHSMLPAGSTLDYDTGTFSWQPGPGFKGVFPLYFTEPGSGVIKRLTIIIQ